MLIQKRRNLYPKISYTYLKKNHAQRKNYYTLPKNFFTLVRKKQFFQIIIVSYNDQRK